LLRLQERKCRINALFLDATIGQTRKGYIVYPFSFYGTDDAEKRKEVSRLRKIETHSLETHARTKYSAVCSKHVLDKDYSVMFSGLTTVDFQRRMLRDDIGIYRKQTS